ncbi:type III-B CRISPR module-associated Cmr3 family protein [Chitinispirillales bacterium ANBcel5]|uniref:type III-B CRISPR module-associated Cmr3 family protein n=1 Tax=Cellulosispirillum alkaliphilum TaxID=3039283 RepID=UPI002A583FB7|nr:type III-B CRISPR module-associated Cmr3 family protein [Chitinispirillales bacterium ANBcel5]
MRYTIQTEDQLILRDGKPFGDEGLFGGTSCSWVMPQTLAGMVRTAIGFAQDPNYFLSEDNKKNILEVGIEKILDSALIGEKHIPLAPIPSDMILTQNEQNDMLTANIMDFAPVPNGCGTDIKNPDWLLPTIDTIGKPSKNLPFRLKWDFFKQYLNGEVKSSSEHMFTSIGIGSPITETRVHNSIDEHTLLTEDGRLFSNKGLYLYAQDGVNVKVPLSISYEITGLKRSVNHEGNFHLGGERKTVWVTKSDDSFPVYESSFYKQKFLKLVLMSYGSFGGWCPQWLMPDLSAGSINYVVIPGTNIKVRLRSACVSGWEGISGWDYAIKKPKPMKKLVKPGSVYLIEVFDEKDSQAVADYFWGSALGESSETREGFGLVVVASAKNQISE